MQRRQFLGATASVGAAYAFGAGFWRSALADTAQRGDGPYGPLAAPDANGIRLPAGFTSAVVAESLQLVPGTGLPWHPAPDGAAVFPTDDGGFVYVCNSELPVAGGVSALRFDAGGAVTDGYRILTATSANCAGGPTPWGTWLSCEEFDLGPPLAGMVWECDPFAPGQGLPKPALGRFSHEAVCVDPVDHRLYLSEDQGDGRFYRFTPGAWRDDGAGVLDAGVLEAAAVAGDGTVTWVPVPDPLAVLTPTRAQAPGTTPFDGGEGLWFDSGIVYLATKGDRRVWAYDTVARRIEVLYDATPLGPDAEASVKVDNVVVSRGGELFVAEDSGDRNRIAVLTGLGAAPTVAPFLEVIEASQGSEVTGPTFDPSATRLFFSSQRGASIRDGEEATNRGITYVVTGPFRTDRASPSGSGTTTTTTTTTATSAPRTGAAAAPRTTGEQLARSGGDGVPGWVAAGLAAAALARRLARRGDSDPAG